jgi:hypothetical protein
MSDEKPRSDEKGDNSLADPQAPATLQMAANDFNCVEHVRMAAHRQAILDLLFQ